MNENEKKRQLKRHKILATGLFILMALGFIFSTYLSKTSTAHWIGYLKAFCEAAMVGALADWFAVTALFHHPLGLKIPHTNLIQSKKDQIGDNLGQFVVGNFLSPEAIRPYILKLKVTDFLGKFLSQPSNQAKILETTREISLNILSQLEDEKVETFIESQVKEVVGELKLGSLLGSGLDYVLEKGAHQSLFTSVSKELQSFARQSKEEIRKKVGEKSYALIPGFVDQMLADKITEGLIQFLEELENNPTHEARKLLDEKLQNFALELKESEKWETELKSGVRQLSEGDRLLMVSKDLWKSLKSTLTKELLNPESSLKLYLNKSLQKLALNLQEDEELKHKIDHWTRVNAYKYFLRNRNEAGKLISSTVTSWNGKELSQKLELEVGKDLQFIRVNGTLVGGLVGLLLYTLSHFLL